jgi:hypothetical protein
MSTRKAFFARAVRQIGLPILVVFFCVDAATAQDAPTHYTFVVASGFVCDAAESGSCAALVKSANGDRYRMSGAGMFSTQGDSLTAAGTFSHESANGAVLETGVWLANELLSFDYYGVAPGALPPGASAFGGAPSGPRRLHMAASSLPTGGLAVFRIRLLPVSGAARTALLQVNCALGDVPPNRSIEGIRLTLENNGRQFSEEAGGRVMFLTMRPEISEPAKSSRHQPTPDSMETQ